MVRLRGALYRKIKERRRRKEKEEVEGIEKEFLKMEQKRIEQKKPTKTWEYRVVALKTSTKKQTKTESWTDILGELGKEGWELLAVIPILKSGSSHHVRCFFKKEVK